MESKQVLIMTKGTILSYHAFWLGEPEMDISSDGKDFLFNATKEHSPFIRAMYGFEKLFPNLAFKKFGKCKITIEEIEDGYIIRKEKS